MNRRSFLAGLLGAAIAPGLPRAIDTSDILEVPAEWFETATFTPAPANPLLEGSLGRLEGLTFQTIRKAHAILAAKAIKPVNGYYVVTLTPSTLDELMRPLTAIERLEMRVREMLALDG